MTIVKCEQTKSMSVSQYYGQLNNYWEELFRHEPLIDCQCCSKCIAGCFHAHRREKRQLHEILMGLYSPYYSQLRTNLLSTDPLPTLDRAYQLVVQDERVRLSSGSVEDKPTDVLGFTVHVPRSRSKGERPICSHCRKVGHEATKCFSLVACSYCKKHDYDASTSYELVGYPEGWN